MVIYCVDNKIPNSLHELFDALLDISRLDAGAMKTEVSVIPLNDLFDQLRVEFEPAAQAAEAQPEAIPVAAQEAADEEAESEEETAEQ